MEEKGKRGGRRKGIVLFWEIRVWKQVVGAYVLGRTGRITVSEGKETCTRVSVCVCVHDEWASRKARR